ncbi:MAG: phosphomannomutase/phosphoglucomutase [Oscillospiraceae bacterium]|nr:phosphomannomutase/phosphoglucomutase [Oscillospiraceae bacterium]
MLNPSWKHFKSGTDIRGVAIDGIDGEPLDLTDEVVKHMATGFAVWLSEQTGKPKNGLSVSVGRDSRISGPRIRDAVIEGLTGEGISVTDCGLASTPAMFMTTVDIGCDGAVQITASHHPYHRNGLKFFTSKGGLESGDISEILETAQKLSEDKNEPKSAELPGALSSVNYMERYAAGLRGIICEGVKAADYKHPLKGFHIIVDAGNGVGGFYADEVLAPLGANIEGSQYLDPDGRFPNHIPNPENKEAMKSVCSATLKAKADLGIIFDTDVDRAGCVDENGREINRNRLIALASAIALEGNRGGTIVTDSITSDGLKIFIEKELGGVHHRFKRGYKNVINRALDLNEHGINCPLAIETSGHAALRENYFLDDGAYLMTKIIIKAAKLRAQGKTLGDLIDKLKEPAESVELRFKITESDFRPVGDRILEELEQYALSKGWDVADDSREGVRISFGTGQGDGWFLLRLSVHDPVMPLNIESNAYGGCRLMAEKLQEFINKQNGLDSQTLTEYLN